MPRLEPVINATRPLSPVIVVVLLARCPCAVWRARDATPKAIRPAVAPRAVRQDRGYTKPHAGLRVHLQRLRRARLRLRTLDQLARQRQLQPLRQHGPATPDLALRRSAFSRRRARLLQ